MVWISCFRHKNIFSRHGLEQSSKEKQCTVCRTVAAEVHLRFRLKSHFSMQFCSASVRSLISIAQSITAFFTISGKKVYFYNDNYVKINYP